MERPEGDPKGPRRGRELERDDVVAEGDRARGNTEQDGGHPHPEPGTPSETPGWWGDTAKKNLLEGQSSSTGKEEMLRGSSSRGPSRAKQDGLRADR